jgi:hypothetical protein
MATNMSQYNPLFNEKLATMIQELLPGSNGLASAQTQAYGLMYQMLQKQANLQSYIDQFRLLVPICLICAPLVFLFTRSRAGKVADDSIAVH